MKTLIVEDDFTSRLLLQELLKGFGPTHVAANGLEAVKAFQMALADKAPYDLVCLDIMMPEMNGQEALKKIRALEEEQNIFSSQGTKIIMTTSLNDPQNVIEAFSGLCDAYLVKPVDKAKLLERLDDLGMQY
ncbi:response regulator [Desulfobulbus rhabdoformis]|uniref:response regulator n=1 Tax=Desulfobulbus rhabdoformis TaxID=34032 RepID=UPI0019669BB0|nr:response regulator [Desulfobulbus rhabdoformis]MBM9614927.1 response regulator [Desulfobulbus rhabdoformis]